MLKTSVSTLGVLALGVWIDGQARAAGGTLAEQARLLIDKSAEDATAADLIAPASARVSDALARAEAASAPEHAALLEAAALEWAQVARDLKRARDAEQASDRLEQEVSALQTEIVRSRAAVEQARARLGRARQELAELEATGTKRSSPERGEGAAR